VHSTVSDIAFSNSGDHLFSASYDKLIKVWSTKTGKFEGSMSHEDKVNRIATNPYNSNMLASCCAKGLVYIWALQGDLSGLAMRDGKVGRSSADAVSFCAEEQFIVVRNWMTKQDKYKEMEVIICDVNKFSRFFHYERPLGYISCLGMFPFTKSRFGIGTIENNESYLRLFDIRCNTLPIWSHMTQQREIQDIAISPCENYIACGGLDSSVFVFDQRFGRVPLYNLSHAVTIEKQGVSVCKFSKEGYLLTGGDDADLRIWDLTTRSQLVHKLNKNDSALTSISFTEDLSFVLAGLDSGAVSIYSASNKEINWNIVKNV